MRKRKYRSLKHQIRVSLENLECECKLFREKINKETEECVELLNSKKDLFRIEHIDTFGSIAHHTFTPFSDIDLHLTIEKGYDLEMEMKKLRDEIRELFQYKESRLVELVRSWDSFFLIKTKSPNLRIDVDVLINRPNNYRTRKWFYKDFASKDFIFQDVVRILKLFARNNLPRIDKSGKFSTPIYPNGFFYECLVSQQRSQIRYHGCTSGCLIKLLESCVEYLVNLKLRNKMVFDYSTRSHHGFSFCIDEHFEHFKSLFRQFLKKIRSNEPMKNLFTCENSSLYREIRKEIEEIKKRSLELEENIEFILYQDLNEKITVNETQKEHEE